MSEQSKAINIGYMILSDYKKYKDAKFDPLLLWDIDLKEFDFQKGKSTLVARTVELGTLNDWYFLLNFFGEKTVVEEIKKIEFLMAKDINFVHKFLQIPLSELKSYQNQLQGKKHFFE